MTKKPHIVLMGIQGSGKGTQARKIREEFDLAYFETGAELRKIAATDTYLGREIKSIIDAGYYVPARCIRDVMGNFIEKNSDSQILFDSPIRSAEQDQVIRPLLGDFVVIHLTLEPDVAINRLLHRRIDPETGDVFPSDFDGDTNPKTGNQLITRIDDTPEAIANRIDYSVHETLPLIDLWRADGHTIYEIDTHASIDQIFAQVRDIISSHT